MLSIDTDGPTDEILTKIGNMKSNFQASAAESITAGGQMLTEYFTSTLGDNSKFLSVIVDIDNFSLTVQATGQNEWAYEVYNDIIADGVAQAQDFVMEQFTERVNR